MNPGCPSRLPSQCFYRDCPSLLSSPLSPRLVRKGFYRRSSDCRWISRFFCLRCQRSFSQASFSAEFRQKKRRLNLPLSRLLCSGVSLRRSARLLACNRKTVVRKLLFLAAQAKLHHQQFFTQLQAQGPLRALEFDEMETFERSKLLPLSVPLLVISGSRKLLGVEVAQMPASGLLAQKSRLRYGPRADQRAQAASKLLGSLDRCLIDEHTRITTDQNPSYRRWLKQAWAEVRLEHVAVPGRKPRAAGLGELKQGARDPLFSLNHTAAMVRANVNRMFRRTWCTTKRPDRLRAHLWVYLDYHNRVLTA